MTKEEAELMEQGYKTRLLNETTIKFFKPSKNKTYNLLNVKSSELEKRKGVYQVEFFFVDEKDYDDKHSINQIGLRQHYQEQKTRD